jgi:hypothetical protein
MIISDTKKFIFIHVPKTGGISIRKCLEPYATVPVFKRNIKHIKKQQTNPKLFMHAQATNLQKFIRKDQWDYFKFAFVRNPWDWMVSHYEYMIRIKDRRSARARKLGFEKYVKWIQRADNKRYPALKAGLKIFITKDDALLVDFVGKYENIKADFDHICSVSDLAHTLPHLNKSKNKKDFRSYYNEETKNIVSKMFSFTIDKFGYSFEK